MIHIGNKKPVEEQRAAELAGGLLVESPPHLTAPQQLRLEGLLDGIINPPPAGSELAVQLRSYGQAVISREKEGQFWPSEDSASRRESFIGDYNQRFRSRLKDQLPPSSDNDDRLEQILTDDRVLALLESSAPNLYRSIEGRKQAFADLVATFDGMSPELLYAEINTRRKEALGRLGAAVLGAEEVPDRLRSPVESRFKRRKIDEHEHYDRSKAKIIDKNPIPSDEEIIADYYNGALEHYKRTLFGSRAIDGLLGFEARDRFRGIDQWQDRRVAETEGRYRRRVAFTPDELVDRDVDRLIGDDVIADLIDELWGQEISSWGGETGQDYAATDADDGRDFAAEYEWSSNSKSEAQRYMDDIKLTSAMEEDFNKVSRLIDRLCASVSEAARNNLRSLVKESLSDMGNTSYDNAKLANKLMRRVARRVHPDVVDPDRLPKHVRDESAQNEIRSMVSMMFGGLRKV